MTATFRIGTAGWSLPRDMQPRFPGEGSHLERYARVFDAAEINSTFHRPHRASTFARWAASVPESFRFPVKVPRTLTHELRLRDAREPLLEFLASLEPLGKLAACLLVQLPPSLVLEPDVARGFLDLLRDRFEGEVALEPRHASWFTAEAEALLAAARVARVAADPPRVEGGMEPGGWRGFAYYRLHGSPRMYYSSYGDDFLEDLAARIRQRQGEGIGGWCIFDNTTLGAGTANALALRERL